MKHYYHIITNFDKKTSTLKKILSNIIFQIAVTKTSLQDKMLTQKDCEIAKKVLRRGDLLLVGQLKRISRYLISGPVTHATLYIGNNEIIHAVSDGVEIINLKDIFAEYDTMIILRPEIDPNKKDRVVDRTIEYATSQIDKPFNFFFEKGKRQFCCTQLVNESFKQANFETGLKNFKKMKFFGKLFKSNIPLHPANFTKGNFDIVYLSSNLVQDKRGDIKLK